jgi:O-succinylbenzoic acid--CoA ligase
VRAGDAELTYGELGDAVRRASAVLAAAGVVPGDRVAVCLPNRLDHLVAIHAVAWLGAVLLPLHPRLGREELVRRLDEAGARLLVAAEGEDPTGFACPVLAAGELSPGTGRAPAAPPPPPASRGVQSLLFTSGSTGRPTAVALTYENHLASAVASALNLGVHRGDDWLCCLPLAHVGGLAIALRSVIYGTALTLVDGFDAREVARLLASGRVSLASLVPTMVRRLLDVAGTSGPIAPRRLRAVLLGGGPMDAATVEGALAAGLPVLATYGMTETSSQIATVPLGAAGARPGSAGPPLFGAEVEVRRLAGGEAGDSDAAAAPPGEEGEIWVRGPMVAVSRADEAGWHRTGDLGRLDADGWLWVAGRRDQVIVTGGENVSPEVVEAVLCAHPEVAECAVTGVSDPEWGRTVAAVVVPRRVAEPPAAEALADHCRAHLARFQVPRRWRIVAALPRTASGKVARAELAALFDDH